MHSSKTPGLARGFSFGVSAYFLWGSFPLIITMLSFASPWEVLVWRMVFGFFVAALLTTFTKSWPEIRSVVTQPKLLGWVVLATVFIFINWTVYVIAVAEHHTIETALGYFINPLVTIVLAVLFLGEKLTRPQWLAVAVGLAAVLVLTFDYGRPPFIAIILAFSFATYGFAKNKLGGKVTAINSFALESGLLLPVALTIGVAVFNIQGLQFGSIGFWGTLGLMFFGLMTAVPLIFFGEAAKLLPLSYIGFIQYVTPVMQFLIALLILREPMPPARWIGFVLVWISLIILSSDALRRGQKRAA
ncbi:MAG: hypothetical protein RI933_892 [Actinomycetota bacterium]|uniref:Protein rarD n=1 Tax=Candidatus Rhodoluna planktonica TaxID=535712 RepID=A0A1D9E050_9MICO|nr:EamA family transporter RarD [Candidatus Rhodoluna planktonica]AOY56452.1 protein rarD [Candidatus Rhodoluna planktonica]